MDILKFFRELWDAIPSAWQIILGIVSAIALTAAFLRSLADIAGIVDEWWRAMKLWGRRIQQRFWWWRYGPVFECYTVYASPQSGKEC